MLSAEEAAAFGPVGVAGCGMMGRPMAEALMRAGFEVWGFDVRPVAEFGAFAPRMVADPAAFAQRCPTIFTVVRDAAETDRLLFDDQALLATGAVRTLAISSTLSPRYLETVAARAPDGVTLVDAPMSGAEVAAQEARLSFMVGGPDAELDRLERAFLAMGRVVHRMGGFGAGMRGKVLNNYVLAASLVAVRQALGWADMLGVDRDQLRGLMHDSSGQTWIGSNFPQIEFAPLGYAPDNSIAIIEKDVRAALDAVQASPEEGLQGAVLAGLRALTPLD